MRKLCSINAEGGPLLLVDAPAANGWRGADGGDYGALCASFDGAPEAEGVALVIAGRRAVAWELRGGGTADVFRGADGSLRIVRAWVESEEEIEALATLESASQLDLGELEVPSGLLAVLWAAESGSGVPVASESEVESVDDTSMGGTAFVLGVEARSYRCLHDEVRTATSLARRLTLVSAARPLGDGILTTDAA